jgi:hypothetical protein
MRVLSHEHFPIITLRSLMRPKYRRSLRADSIPAGGFESEQIQKGYYTKFSIRIFILFFSCAENPQHPGRGGGVRGTLTSRDSILP